MQIEISGETERFIQAALESGQYASAEKFIEVMARNLRPKVRHFEVAETYVAESAAASTTGWEDTEMDVFDDNAS